MSKKPEPVKIPRAFAARLAEVNRWWAEHDAGWGGVNALGDIPYPPVGKINYLPDGTKGMLVSSDGSVREVDVKEVREAAEKAAVP